MAKYGVLLLADLNRIIPCNTASSAHQQREYMCMHPFDSSCARSCLHTYEYNGYDICEYHSILHAIYSKCAIAEDTVDVVFLSLPAIIIVISRCAFLVLIHVNISLCTTGITHPWQHFFQTLLVLQTNFPAHGKLVCKTIPLETSPPKSISGTP